MRWNRLFSRRVCGSRPTGGSLLSSPVDASQPRACLRRTLQQTHPRVQTSRRRAPRRGRASTTGVYASSFGCERRSPGVAPRRHRATRQAAARPRIERACASSDAACTASTSAGASRACAPQRLMSDVAARSAVWRSGARWGHSGCRAGLDLRRSRSFSRAVAVWTVGWSGGGAEGRAAGRGRSGGRADSVNPIWFNLNRNFRPVLTSGFFKIRPGRNS